MAYPIAVRHPKFHHGSGIVCSLCEPLFNYRSSKVWHRLPSFHHSGQAWKALKDENKVSRSYLAVTKEILALRSHRERYNRSHTLPPDRRFTLVVEVTTVRCIVNHQVAVNRSCKRSLSLESFTARQSAVRRPSFLSLRPRRRSNMT